MSKRSKKHSGSTSERVPSTNESDAAGEREAPATAAGGGDRDATPSNTASYKDNQQVFFQPLRWGVDSLYLSYSGLLIESVETSLKELKERAQSSNPSEIAIAQYPLEDYIFNVRDKGARFFPYVLEHPALRIQLSGGQKLLPFAYVKVSSGFLASMAVANVEPHVRELISLLGLLDTPAKVGRIDLFVDFVTDCDLEGWGREAWVTRASSINTYSVDGRFSGWGIGFGGPMAARLYDKTLEIEKSGKYYLMELWRQAGWDGNHQVWRLEIQIKREVLFQLQLKDCESVISHLNGLWDYALTQWLKLAIPNPQDSKRSRWPIHPLWALLSSVDWETDGGPLLREYPKTSTPSDEWLFASWLRTLVSYMAKTGIMDIQVAHDQLHLGAVSYYEGVASQFLLNFPSYVWGRVAIKQREYCSAFNADETPQEKRIRVDAEAHKARVRDDAESYRKGSDGE